MSHSNEGFEALFNNAAIGIITVDIESNILLVNQFAQKQFGYTSEELIGEKIELLIPKRFKERHIQHRDNYLHHNPHSRPMGTGLDLFAIKKDGTEFPVEVSLSTYKNQTGQFAIAFISDITIRKQSEHALVQLNAELEQKVAERTQSLTAALEKEIELNELKSRFVSMASHEFRTPLSTILSSTYLVSKYTTTEDQSRRDKHIQRIVSSVTMLTDTLNDFLSVGRIEEGKIQVRYSELSVHELIGTIINEMQSILKNGQEIIYRHTGSDAVTLDATLMQHIIMNLLSNAIKFSPENTDIEINTANDHSRFILSVRDKGIGIPREDQEHLFERFFRGTNVTNIQGTGLGLHIVSKYSEIMNGSVICNSELEKGTEFVITFHKTDAE